MYLRTTSRRNADGSVVRYYQLAENAWDPARGCAVAKIVYNFGRADEVDGDKMRRLAKSILRAFGGQEQAAATEGVRLLDARPYGGVYVLEQLWKELGLDTLLNGLRGRRVGQPFERALFAMVANRALSPYSKLYCWEQWLREEVFMPEASELKLQHLYRAMDFFESHKLEVEKTIDALTNPQKQRRIVRAISDILRMRNDAKNADLLEAKWLADKPPSPEEVQ